ncbi:RHE_PE00001 family protein [Rhizobium sp. LjRoot30]|uniref:RHE_PE00001 family protein n=1 Tax=Rhizobium sp. LjRoot30 TaxID=3342320 RepID=UPI003F4F970A
MPMVYRLDTIPLDRLITPVARATAMLARLDERVARSPIGPGWIERAHFQDAVSSLWIDGELVHLEDLVLHDNHMDIRAPTHELVRAHSVLRARRQIFAHPPDWALSPAGLRQLAGRGSAEAPALPAADPAREQKDDETDDGEEHRLDEELAAIDAVLKRSSETMARLRNDGPDSTPRERDPLAYDLDWDEDGRLDEWQRLVEASQHLPPALRGVLLLDAWRTIDVLQHVPWLGRLLVAALLRQAGLVTAHLAALNSGLRAVPRELRHAPDRTTRLIALLQAMEEAATLGLKEHDRLVQAKAQMERRLKGRRSNSKLPQLVDLVLSRPMVSSTMIEQELKVTQQGALNLVADLNLREMTGRRRFQAWGVI